jgi:predicted porin
MLRFAPLALCACVGSAFADDSSVTLYGTLDTAVANIQHSLNFDPLAVVSANPTISGQHGTSSATGLFNGAMSASRWGIKGQEDMGGGLKAVFLLESGINLPSGNLSNGAGSLARNNADTGPATGLDSAVSGQLFSRGAYAGLSSTDYGTLTVGRQQSFFLDNVAIFDPLLGSQAFSPLGFSGSYGGGGYTDDSRVDNSLKYKVSISDFTLGLMYKFGGVAGSTSAQSAYQINAVYATGPFAVQAGYEEFKDAFSLANSGTDTIKATAADTKSFMVAGKFSFDPMFSVPLTVRAGFEREEFNNPSDPGTAAVGATPATGDQAVTSLFNQTVTAVSVTAFPNQKNLNVYWIGGDYAITSAFSLLAGYYHVSQNDYDSTNCANGKQLARCSGGNNYYSLVADYHFSKRTDTYFGVMESNGSGGLVAGLPNTSDRIIALGFRHMF